MNLLEPILDELTVRSGRAAIIAADGARATYGDLVERSAALAAGWKRAGIVPGDRVLIAMPVGVGLFASLVALWRLGAVAVFPEPALGLRGLRHALEATRPKAFLSAGWFRFLRYALPALWPVPLTLSASDLAAGRPPADDVEPVAAEHPALISFTSGSTGRPKAIVRSHRFLALQNARVAELLAPERDGCVDLVGFPVFVLANLSLGVTSVLPNWPLSRQETADTGGIARHIADNGVNRALIPPSICAGLVDGPDVALDTIFTGGGPVFPDLLNRLSSKLPGADIVSVYGSTEAEPIAHQRLSDISAEDWRAMREGGGLLAGPPIPEIRVKILEDEIVVTGEHVNKGYLDERDDRTTKMELGGEIWHRTGDSGRLDADGRLWLLGRQDGRAGGLFPFGVEAAARFWPGVVRAALVLLDDRPVLAIEGDAALRDTWQEKARAMGGVRVVPLRAIPLDRRHGSKVDYPALRASLGRLMRRDRPASESVSP
ncbi:AMP-binding protein [Chelativorans salis]|uniref:AMP-binding protein n=1 Tax=Chelativorans salis TaxID=2978478 RepID=A0ABT2LGM3_9HYPH|nr:AMP-binding protein [Chelativorans sp. EGI FJ00035]MCT7373656.1 AMP-binding protein [Chelativorans sp. EGI FJ00035]